MRSDLSVPKRPNVPARPKAMGEPMGLASTGRKQRRQAQAGRGSGTCERDAGVGSARMSQVGGRRGAVLHSATLHGQVRPKLRRAVTVQLTCGPAHEHIGCPPDEETHRETNRVDDWDAEAVAEGPQHAANRRKREKLDGVHVRAFRESQVVHQSDGAV